VVIRGAPLAFAGCWAGALPTGGTWHTRKTEPLQAGPVVIENNCFIGARSEVVEGVIVREGSVLGMGVYIGISTKIVDRETGKIKGKMTLKQFKDVIDINLTGVFLTIRECAEKMVNHDCKGLICLISSTGSLGTAGQLNYSATKAAMSVMPKVITAEFFRRGLAHKVRCVAVAPGYVGTAMVKGMNQKALDKIIENVPINRLVEPEEVASLIGELYRNEAINGDVYFIHGGLRLGSKG
jgi:NAD(P)-dependent dehydrogenase (short-subunit alcohol dehydrogenase family)